ncbi:MAG: hypothetical protein II980_01805, partial [Clostridia bacterium]|nr:hypothetical protein [Clostridia bacterium]
MKKFLSLILILIMITMMVISCNKALDTLGTDTSSNTNSDTSNETNTDTSTDSGTSTDNETKSISLEYNYVFFDASETLSGKPFAKLLCGSSYLAGALDNINSALMTENIIAGDVLHIDYTGELEYLEQYPQVINLEGRVVSYGMSLAEVIHIQIGETTIKEIKETYNLQNEYIILDENGSYTTLGNYTGSDLYLVEKSYNSSWETISSKSTKKDIACVYAYNPRKGINENEIKFEADFVYNHTNNKVSLLFGHTHLKSGFENIAFPDNIIAGDILYVEHSGEIIIQETYPSQTFIVDGELLSYRFSYANVVRINKEDLDIDKLKSKYILPYKQNVINQNLEYVSLEEYISNESNTVLYLTIKQEYTDIEEKPQIVGMYSCNPRTMAEAGEAVFEADFVYDNIFDQETKEPLVALLFDDTYLHISEIEYPNNLVAGDKLYIKYNGTLKTLETYPSSTYLYGELISYRFELAQVIYTEDYYLYDPSDDEIIMGEGTALSSKENVILNSQGSYTTLESFVKDNPNAPLYLSV